MRPARGSADALRVAVSIGESLVRTALWHGDRCTWLVGPLGRPKCGGTARGPAGPSLYRGTAGIALFLIQLYRYTGEPVYARTASGALRDAASQISKSAPDAIGLYAGRTGVAWACALSQALGTDEHVAQLSRQLEEVDWARGTDRSFDLIAGAAGAIVGNLCIAETIDDRSYAMIARDLGMKLIERAFRGPNGWSWGEPCFQHSRNLTGLAHGASGAAWALAELYAATGEGQFLYAAEQGVAYERACFNTRTRNWPDFRIPAIGDLVDDPSQIPAAIEANPKLLEPNDRYMAAWCHGAPGIALTRFRMYDILLRGNGGILAAAARNLLDEGLNAARTTAASLRSNVGGHNYSLCHGATGNCDALFSALEHMDAHAYDTREFRSLTERCASFGIEHYQSGRSAWPCGTWARRNDPSLMVGEAGIGLWYLRLHASDTVCPTLPHPQLSPDREAVIDDAYLRLRAECIHEYFGRTLGNLNGMALRVEVRVGGSPVNATYRTLKKAASAGRLPPRAREAFDLERRIWRVARSRPGWPARLLPFLGGLPGVIPTTWRLQLAKQGVELTLRNEDDVENAFATVIWITPVACQVKNLAGLSAFVLGAARRPTTMQALIDRVANRLESPSAEALVQQHVRSALLDGLLVRIYPPRSASMMRAPSRP